MRTLHAICRGLLVAGVVSCVLWSLSGCTRQFYRKRADSDVADLLHEKDVFQEWKIRNMHVYPDPRARFADPFNPDRPPMPPDDAAAKELGPNPQRPPRKAGIAVSEGNGYLDMLAVWDAENRAVRAVAEKPEIMRASFLPEPGELQEKPELIRPPMRMPAGEVAPLAEAKEKSKETGYLLRIDQAMELGLFNSREFQTRREELYLTALDVTRQRFAFAPQAYATENLIRERTGANVGPGKGDRWTAGTQAGIGKLFSTGALLLFQFANQTVVELTNPALRRTTSVSTINLDVIQPLLRGGGRAVTLEPLTQAERNLLYEIRDYARFRKQFYQYITAGGGIPVNGSPFSGLINGGQLASGVRFPAGAQSVSPSPVGVPQAGFPTATPRNSFLDGILAGAQLEINRQNVAYLENGVELLKNFERGGRVAPLQVGLLQQELLSGQVAILQSEQILRDTLDGFKLQLGIPQNVPLELDDCVLRDVIGQLQKYDKAIKDYEAASDRLEKYLESRKADELRGVVKELLTTSPLAAGTKEFRDRALPAWEKWRAAYPDDKVLKKRVDELERRRRVLVDERETLALDNLFLPPEKEMELQTLEAEYPYVKLEAAVREFEAAPWIKGTEAKDRDRVYNRLAREVRNIVLFVLIDASNERLRALRTNWPNLPPAVVCGVDILTADLEEAYAAVTKTAYENRLDLMNARAQVHDAWRKVAVFANSLLGTFNVAYHLDSSTPPDMARPLAFQPSRTRHQLIMNMELPLVRLSERNAYRAALIGYQRARRSLQEAEDLVANEVRFEVRQLRVIGESYKINQEAVELAYRQVEQALEQFRQPPAPEGGGSDAASLTQQLIGAYRKLPSSQNQLLRNWIDYRSNRQQLYVDLELMWIDDRGVWHDELTLDPCSGPPDQRHGPHCSFGQPAAGILVGPPAPAVGEKELVR